MINNKSYEEVRKKAVDIFKELQQRERVLLEDQKEFSRNLDCLVEEYQEARKRVAALKFREDN